MGFVVCGSGGEQACAEECGDWEVGKQQSEKQQSENEEEEVGEDVRDVAEHLREVVRVAVSRLAGFSDAQVRANPYPPKWSKIQVLGHLVDSACNNQQKFVRVMELPVGRGGESNLVFPGYAQNHWVDAQGYQDAQWSALVKLFELYNMHLAFVIERVRPELLANTITIEGPKGPAGPYTLEFIMRDYVEHMKHHLLQIDDGMGVKSGFVNVYGA